MDLNIDKKKNAMIVISLVKTQKIGLYRTSGSNKAVCE